MSDTSEQLMWFQEYTMRFHDGQVVGGRPMDLTDAWRWVTKYNSLTPPGMHASLVTRWVTAWRPVDPANLGDATRGTAGADGGAPS